MKVTYLDQDHWFIDAIFAVNDNTRSHTGAHATFRKGTIDGLAKGKPINTISSIKTKEVGVHENMPAILWSWYFLEAQ